MRRYHQTLRCFTPPWLLAHDVFVRMPAVAPLDRTIRVTVGAPEERSVFAEALERVLETIN